MNRTHILSGPFTESLFSNDIYGSRSFNMLGLFLQIIFRIVLAMRFLVLNVCFKFKRDLNY
ncbi:MAG TPA: hypothetical protein DCK76_04075 [Desulfotomaculum sp.]|nr:hypothetical protein [Desulfotomaculum sp.]HBY03454.1 hypothetical protein [Desulfotomaculum sp.]